MPLTPEQFSLLVTKDEHEVLEAKVDMISENVVKLLASVDGLAQNVVKFREELSSNQAAHDRIEEKIDDQGVRIGKLEASIA